MGREDANQAETREARFIRECDEAVARFGRFHAFEDRLAKISGTIPFEEETKAYVDTMILIVASTKSKALHIKRLENSNPVVMRSPEGEVYRWHGEAVHLFDHVRALLNGGVR